MLADDNSCIDAASLLRQDRLRWYGHVLRKDDSHWVKRGMAYEMESVRHRCRPKKTWQKLVKNVL